MLKYTPPLRDLSFILQEVLHVETRLAQASRYVHVDGPLLDTIAEEAGRFAAERVLALNRQADRTGCKWEAGVVKAPPGFGRAYDEYRQLGWPGMCADSSVGGQEVPRAAFSIVHEMIAAGSHAFGMVAAINHCASTCLRHSASHDLQRQWLPLLASGEVLSSMCMTEPGAGSDIGLLTTRAREQDEDTYRVSGTKIFVSGGEHDLTENILHLVLARTPGSPPGSRGVSLFLVPKILSNGDRNAVHCDGIEEKMGLHGSPTCTLRFEEAIGWLVGEVNHGLRAMFPMMNEARLLSGLQAVGVSEVALQNAWQYALERRQGKSRSGSGPCALVEHRDIQRMLLTQKALTEGGRALTHWTAMLIDEAECHESADRRAHASELLAVLTPIVKGFLTENAQHSIGLALQVFGGHGYVAETGIEQLVRDIRVTTIYEGTTGIQAQDLLMRKVIADGGARLTLLFDQVGRWLNEAESIPAIREFTLSLSELLQQAEMTTKILIECERETEGAALSSCTPYLRLLGHLTLGYVWAQMAAASWNEAAHGERWYALKLETARFYFRQLMPEAASLSRQIATPAEVECDLLRP